MMIQLDPPAGIQLVIATICHWNIGWACQQKLMESYSSVCGGGDYWTHVSLLHPYLVKSSVMWELEVGCNCRMRSALSTEKELYNDILEMLEFSFCDKDIFNKNWRLHFICYSVLKKYFD